MGQTWVTTQQTQHNRLRWGAHRMSQTRSRDWGGKQTFHSTRKQTSEPCRENVHWTGYRQWRTKTSPWWKTWDAVDRSGGGKTAFIKYDAMFSSQWVISYSNRLHNILSVRSEQLTCCPIQQCDRPPSHNPMWQPFWNSANCTHGHQMCHMNTLSITGTHKHACKWTKCVWAAV